MPSIKTITLSSSLRELGWEVELEVYETGGCRITKTNLREILKGTHHGGIIASVLEDTISNHVAAGLDVTDQDYQTGIDESMFDYCNS